MQTYYVIIIYNLNFAAEGTQSPSNQNNPHTPSSSQSPAHSANPTTHSTTASTLAQTVTSSSSSLSNNCGSGTDHSAPDLTSENLPDDFEFDQSILGHHTGDNGEVEGTLDVSRHWFIYDGGADDDDNNSGGVGENVDDSDSDRKSCISDDDVNVNMVMIMVKLMITILF